MSQRIRLKDPKSKALVLNIAAVGAWAYGDGGSEHEPVPWTRHSSKIHFCRLRCPKIPFEASVLHPIQCTAKHCIMGFLAIQQKFDSFLALSILNVKI